MNDPKCIMSEDNIEYSLVKADVVTAENNVTNKGCNNHVKNAGN